MNIIFSAETVNACIRYSPNLPIFLEWLGPHVPQYSLLRSTVFSIKKSFIDFFQSGLLPRL